jgi:hypothetical protein
VARRGRRHPFAAQLAVATWLVSTVARAAPATVKDATDARSTPDEDAAVVQHLEVGEKVSADERPENGWRRIRLSDGGVGFVLNFELDVAAAPPSDEDDAAPAARPTLNLRDLDHLALVAKPDTVVGPMAERLVTRRTVGRAVIVGSTLVGLTLVILSINAATKADCTTMHCEANTSVRLDLGVALTILGPLIGWAITPGRGDLIDVVNRWNGRHPDDQVRLGP